MIPRDLIIGLKITSLSHKIVRALEAQLLESLDKNISATSARIICFLVEVGASQNIFQKDIELFMGLNRSSVSLILKTMEQHGFIRRSTMTGDARYKKIEATEKSMTYYPSITQAFDKVEERMRVGLGDLAPLMEALHTINQNLDA